MFYEKRHLIATNNSHQTRAYPAGQNELHSYWCSYIAKGKEKRNCWEVIVAQGESDQFSLYASRDFDQGLSLEREAYVPGFKSGQCKLSQKEKRQKKHKEQIIDSYHHPHETYNICIHGIITSCFFALVG